MKVQQNIGIVNALIRITFGFTILAWSTAKLVKRPWRESYILVAMMAAMKIGEGIVRYCPLTALYEKSQNENTSKSGGNNRQSENGSQGPKHQDERRARQQS